MRFKKALTFAVCTLAVAGMALSGCGSSSGGGQTASGDFDSSSDITVLSREDGSGTRSAFIELFGIEEKNEDGEKEDMTTVEATITNNTEVMMSTVAGNPYAIGYCSLGSLNDSIKAVKIDGVEATTENVADGSYAVSRPFNIVTQDQVSDAAQDFINFIMSDEGQAVISDNGYIAVAEGASYQCNGASGKVAVAGSSSVSPVMEKLGEAYEEANPDVNVEIQTSDSTTGITAAMEGSCDIGMASRALTEDETGVSATQIAIDGIAVIENLDNPTDDLSPDMVKSIFTGETTIWDEVY